MHLSGHLTADFPSGKLQAVVCFLTSLFYIAFLFCFLNEILNTVIGKLKTSETIPIPGKFDQ